VSSQRLTEEEARQVLASAIPIAPREGSSPVRIADVVGHDLEGTHHVIALTSNEHRSLLLFLSTQCLGCDELFRSAASPEVLGVVSPDEVVIVARESENPEELQTKVGTVPCVQSDQAFREYQVTGAPFFSLIDPSFSTVASEGVAWGADNIARAVRAAMEGAPESETGRLLSQGDE